MKVTFMGAGSTVFAKNVLGDIMLTPALRECDIALYDIDPERLEESYLMVTALNRNINENRASVSKYLGVEERKDALRGADFVINAIQVGLYDPCTIIDFEVPKIRTSPDYRGFERHRRNFQSSAHYSRPQGFHRRYERSLSERIFP